MINILDHIVDSIPISRANSSLNAKFSFCNSEYQHFQVFSNSIDENFYILQTIFSNFLLFFCAILHSLSKISFHFVEFSSDNIIIFPAFSVCCEISLKKIGKSGGNLIILSEKWKWLLMMMMILGQWEVTILKTSNIQFSERFYNLQSKFYLWFWWFLA